MNHAFRFLIFISLTSIVYFLAPYEWFGTYPQGKAFVPSDEPEIFKRKCHFMEAESKRNEGKKQSREFKLRGLIVIFRNGERFTDKTISDKLKPGCIPFISTDRKIFDSYTTLLKKDRFKSFLKIDSDYIFKEQHSDPYHCHPDQLTPEGTIQLLKLGSYLRHTYEGIGLFDDIGKTDILVSSSLHHYTFQSAIAFISSFLYSLSNLSEILLKASYSTYFCLDNRCICPNYTKLYELVEMMKLEEFIKHSPNNLIDRIETFSQFVGLSEVNNPLKFLDVISSLYMCRRIKLPCKSDGDCLHTSDIIDADDELAKIFNKTRASKISRQKTLIEAWTLLSHITNSITAIKNGTQVIKILSGNYMTLEPLMQIFSIKEEPHHASDLLFEIYESSISHQNETLFVRVLFNGKDQTAGVKFCKSLVNGMCASSEVEAFVNDGIFKNLDVEGFEQLCA